MRDWIRDLTDFVFLQDDPAPADILFIAGNAHAEPAERAAGIYRAGYAPLVLPSGRYAAAASGFPGQQSGARRYSGRFESEWAFMRRVLMESGVPSEAILREDRARFTYQNAIASRARGTEIRVRAALKASELQKKVDQMAKEARLVDNLLQETNWKTELIEA